MEESNKYAELKSQLENQGRVIDEIKDTQIKIANALLGSFDKTSIGLIEESRTQRRDINILNTVVNTLKEKVEVQENFRTDTKKIVASIALAVPFLFEVVKGAMTLLWEYLKSIK